MASGLQCPGCGHVHPAGLPEIARGDETFRCYGCYRMLSVPEGWNGRPSSRPEAPELSPTGDAPPGAGMRDARSARLAGRQGRAGTLTGSAENPTQMVPPLAPDGTTAGGAIAPSGTAGARATGPAATGAPARRAAAPLGWVAPRRSGRPLPTSLRIGVWAAAFVLGLAVSTFILRKIGILSVNAVIDLYAGTGLGRFGILVVLLPLWAVLSALIAHFSLEGLTKRRDARASSAPPATTSPPL